MQFTTTAITALLASASLAIARPVNERRQFEAQITFIGAAGAEYSISAPTDATSFVIDHPLNYLSISKITSLGGATCSFFGSEGSNTVVVGAHTVDVGPPQPQVSGSCLAF